MIVVEKELRRSCKLTKSIKNRLREKFTRPLHKEYIIYFQNKRAVVNGEPSVRQKDSIKSYLKLLYTNKSQTIEMCYESNEYSLSAILSNDMIKHGVLVKKTYYFNSQSCLLYTLENVETSLMALAMQNKLVLELEEPDTASDSIKNTYIEYVNKFDLVVDMKSVNFSVENVKHDFKLNNLFEGMVQECSKNNLKVYPKIDGERGILQFYSGYETYTSNTKSFTLKPALHEIWGREICFRLANIPFVCEYESNSKKLVIIDLALADYFTAQQRLEFILKLGEEIRKNAALPHPQNSNVLFQGCDVEFIKKHCKLDGSIIIYNNKIYKKKSLLTADLQYLSLFKGMVDRDGMFYSCQRLNHKRHLKNNKIYECVLDKGGRIVNSVLKMRNDKFYPNTRKTVLKALSPKCDVTE